MTIKMNEKFKRYLLLIPAMTLLTGCGNDADSIQNTERVVSNEDSVKYDEVYINHNKDDSKNKEVYITYNKADTQEEVYELFLNGELTVELEEEHVTIDKLFWNNDIEYCFGDIDGDGSEELHIRDEVMYYAIKVVDGIPQILFEGWWDYEPVVTDEACGILHYRNKYNAETIEFITIETDGSTESDGEFSEIGTGRIYEDNDVENEYYGYDYYWEGSLMTEEEYKECLNKLIDTSKCIYPEELYSKDEILEIIAR